MTRASRPLRDPDVSWVRLHRWGGACAFLYIVLAILVPLGMVVAPGYDFDLGGADLLEYIAEHRLWWFAVQGLVLAPSVFLIVTFAALYEVTRHLERTMAAVGGPPRHRLAGALPVLLPRGERTRIPGGGSTRRHRRPEGPLWKGAPRPWWP